jgi:ATP-dependent Lon protease
MENGQINHGTITIPGEASFVFNGNINFDPRQSMQAEHLFKPLPGGIADDTAFHDRWSAYLPGWEMPKLTPELITNHTGLSWTTPASSSTAS